MKCPCVPTAEPVEGGQSGITTMIAEEEASKLRRRSIRHVPTTILSGAIGTDWHRENVAGVYIVPI